ncbi:MULTISPECIES: VOC family protein [unclassified Minwuia]|uniref:VOC family protein n=1 Tax=unclassified Minwuia TaxID=2618799 RepID=UPI002479D2B4|nr:MULTISPECIES: VOC family protein [unclassified Minwuia]
MNDQVARFAWGHINVNVSNLERSIAFYEKLGFELYRDGIPYLDLTMDADGRPVPNGCARALGLPEAMQGRACIMQLGRGYPKLDLTEFRNHTGAKPLTSADVGIVRLCLASKNLQEDHARLSAEGVAFLSTPQSCKDGMADIAICTDPDGTLIELIQVDFRKWPPQSSPD